MKTLMNFSLSLVVVSIVCFSFMKKICSKLNVNLVVACCSCLERRSSSVTEGHSVEENENIVQETNDEFAEIC